MGISRRTNDSFRFAVTWLVACLLVSVSLMVWAVRRGYGRELTVATVAIVAVIVLSVLFYVTAWSVDVVVQWLRVPRGDR